jgi:hypothetical protein
MDWERAYKDLIENFWPIESQWIFDTSAGAEASFTSPGVKVGIAATGGAIWLRQGLRGRRVRLTYGGIGPTGGLGNLVPSPVNFSFSLPAMTSTGVIYKMPAAGKTLSESELKGGFMVFQASADVGAGISTAAIFMGGNYALAVASGPLFALVLLTTSKALLTFAGMSATLLPCNWGGTAYVGMVQ